jgi:hypothetical protein
MAVPISSSAISEFEISPKNGTTSPPISFIVTAPVSAFMLPS